MIAQSSEFFGVRERDASFAAACGPHGMKAERTAPHAIDVGVVVNFTVVSIKCEPAVTVGTVVVRAERVIEPAETSAGPTVDYV